MFENRADAARQLGESLQDRTFEHPLVLGIPRGGMVVASVLAEAIDAECDIVLARKLRSPDDPELAIGAVSETGEVYFNHAVDSTSGLSDAYVHAECQAELREIDHRQKLVRAVRMCASIVGRSVIIADDGIATGATMIAALQVVRMQHPVELLVAVPVAPRNALHDVRNWCDEMHCLLTPRLFTAVGQFYQDFESITDEEVLILLRDAARNST